MKKTVQFFLLGITLFSGYVKAGEVTGVNPAESSKLIVNPNQSVIKLFYQGEKQGKVTVRIFDENNALIYMDRIYNKNGFVRPYNFRELGTGKYKFEITDCEGKVEKVAEYTLNKTVDNSIIRARLTPVEAAANKLKLDVMGVIDETVFVKIFDEDNHEIFSEIIDIQQSFSRVYNLRKLRDQQVSFEVSTENKLLLKQ